MFGERKAASTRKGQADLMTNELYRSCYVRKESNAITFHHCPSQRTFFESVRIYSQHCSLGASDMHQSDQRGLEYGN